MEGVGSRLGRASSRYGPAAAVFNGPVRKWKKKWVHVSSSSTVSYHNSQSNGQSSETPRLLLCRWTPLPPTSAATAAAGNDSAAAVAPLDEPPRRKFRYTPIAVLEDQKKVGEKKVEDEAKTSETDQAPATARPPTTSDEVLGKPAVSDDLKEETEDSSTSNLDLGLGLKSPNKSPNKNIDAIGDTKETQMKKASSSGFWSTELEA